MEEYKLIGWVARNSREYYNDLILFIGENPPHRMMTYWSGCGNVGYIVLTRELFPELRWEDEPMKVEICLTQFNPQFADMEDYEYIKRILSLGFMHFLDENRKEGKMCLSNGECADIDRAFDERDWGRLVRYAKKFLP